MARARFALMGLALAASAAALLVVPAPAAAAEPNVRATKYDVRLDVQPDGSLDVVETITLSAGAEPMTRFDRTVSRRRTDGFTNVSALMDGHTVPVSIDSSGDLKIGWDFSPTANATHAFEIRYRAVHVLDRELDGPRLLWTALPPRHSYPIDASVITVFAPAGSVAAAVDAPGGELLPSTPDRPGIAIGGTSLGSDRTIAVDITFAPNSITPAEPQWFVAQSRQAEMRPAWLAGAACLLVTGVGILVMAFAQLPKRGAPETGGSTLERVTEERRRARAWLLATGLVLVASGLIGGGAMAALIDRFGPAPIAIPAAVLLTGLIYLVAAWRMSVNGGTASAG